MTADQNPYASPAIVTDQIENEPAAHAHSFAPYISPRSRANFTSVFMVLSVLANLGLVGCILFTQSLLQQISTGYQPTAAEIQADGWVSVRYRSSWLACSR